MDLLSDDIRLMTLRFLHILQIPDLAWSQMGWLWVPARLKEPAALLRILALHQVVSDRYGYCLHC